MEHDSKPKKESPVWKLLHEILADAKLPKPDGRPIYRYKISDKNYKEGRDLIFTYSGLLDPTNMMLCAVLTFVTAEWYRREARSLFRTWGSLGFIPDDLTVEERGKIVDAGLKWWDLERKTTRKIQRKRREFLLTLALNGGLPSAMIIGQTANNVRTYFEAVMADALSEHARPTPDEVEILAVKHQDHLPASYCDDTIYELTGELIANLVDCKRRLPDDRQEANPAGWLDQHYSGWRELLPIYLPEEAESCNKLFNNLLSIEPRAKGGGVGVRRILFFDQNSGWEEGFTVHADGKLAFEGLAQYSEGRFRTYFDGTASRLVSRDFAHVYRSENDKKGNFEVTSRAVGQLGLIGPVPFSETIAVKLLRDGLALPPVPWPGGQPMLSDCLVLKPTDRQDRLELIGRGSTRSSSAVLFAYVPADAQALGHDGGSAECVWTGHSKSLWRIEGQVVVTLTSGDRYRVAAGSEVNDERRLEFDTIYNPDIEFDDTDVAVVEAPLQPRQRGAVGASQGQLRLTRKGRQLTLKDVGTGIVSVLWQDQEGFAVDRCRVLVLPSGFQLKGTIETNGALISWGPMPGWNLQAIDALGNLVTTQNKGPDTILCPWQNGPLGVQRLKLTDPGNVDVTLTLHLGSKKTLLVDSQGRICAENIELSPAELRGARLITGWPHSIDLELKDAGTARALVTRRIDGETPMVRFSDLAQNLLGLSEERGPFVVVTYDHQRVLCRIRRPRTFPKVEGDKVTFSEPLQPGNTVVARSLIQAAEEVLLSSPDGQTYTVPDEVLGPCLVYMRKGDAVVTRPVPVIRPLAPSRIEGINPASKLAMIENECERRENFIEALRDGATELSGEIIADIGRIVYSLKGLSPRAIDFTRELPKCPAALCRLLLAAPRDRIDSILQLERDLPFLWMALPIAAWRQAAQAEFVRATQDFAILYGPGDAAKKAGQSIVSRFNELSERTRWFAGIQCQIWSRRELISDLRNLAQDHVRVHGDGRDPVAAKLLAIADKTHIPDGLANLSYRDFPTLLAPLVLARIAQEEFAMTPDFAAALRDAIDNDPDYIALAFPHCLELKS